MPGRHVTDCQKRLFMKLGQTHTIEVASAKAGFSRATGYLLAADPTLFSKGATPRAGASESPPRAAAEAASTESSMEPETGRGADG